MLMIRRFEEKAGQLTLNAAAWGGAAATALNPPTAGATFDEQLDQVRRGHLTGVFNVAKAAGGAMKAAGRGGVGLVGDETFIAFSRV